MVQANPFIVTGIVKLNGTVQPGVTVSIRNNTKNQTCQTGWTTDSAGEYAASLSDPVQLSAGYDVGDNVTVSAIGISVTLTVPSGAGTTVGGQEVDLNSITGSDSGTGADALGMQANLPVSDSGVGSDVPGLQATLPLNDVGSGSDVSGLSAQLGISDSGNGSDSLGMTAQLSMSDSGVGSEIVSFPGVLVLNDYGTGAEVFSLTATLNPADSGLGSELVNVTLSISAADSGVGTDSVSVSAAVGVSYPLILVTLDGKILLRVSPSNQAKYITLS